MAKKSNKAAANRLKKINNIARKLRKSNPRLSWTSAMKKAGAMYKKKK